MTEQNREKLFDVLARQAKEREQRGAPDKTRSLDKLLGDREPVVSDRTPASQERDQPKRER